MNRTWYGIATTQMHLSKFWEVCTWNSKGVHTLGPDCYSNHTVTWDPKGKMSDFGVWAGNIKDGNTMGLTITLPMCGGIPVMDTNSTRTAEPRSLTAALLLNGRLTARHLA